MPESPNEQANRIVNAMACVKTNEHKIIFVATLAKLTDSNFIALLSSAHKTAPRASKTLSPQAKQNL